MIIELLVITAYLNTGHSAANNHLPIEGITVAGPRCYALGTHVRVEGFTNDFIINDRTAKRFDGRIDIYFGTHTNEATIFGRQKRRVTIYDSTMRR